MKTRERLLAGIVFAIISVQATAQCVTPLQFRTYDTVVTGSGNSANQITFPKFDPTLGTLTEVEINAKVTMSYSFQLENKEPIPIYNYRVRVVREHEISSSALSVPLTNVFQKTYGNFLLWGADGILGSGPDYMAQGPLYVMNQSNIAYTVYNTADYLGVGNVSFDYNTSTYSIVFGSVNNNIDGTAEDTINFSITYKYCTTWFLDVNITTFTAKKKDDATIDLQWTTNNENNERYYELQKSTDGRNFKGLAQFPAKADATATGTYSYRYPVQQNDYGKIIFRIKQVEKDGTTQYSEQRIVDLKRSNVLQPHLYPNPSTGGPVTLVLNSQKRYDWDVEILSAGGQLMQRYQLKNALLVRLNTRNELQKGLYFVKVTNKKSQEQFIQRLLIQ